MSYLFSSCESLKELDKLKWDVSNVISMKGMFEGCLSLKDISGISNLNLNKVKNISRMFKECEKLISVPKLNWNTSNVVDMSEMFHFCKALKDISGISNFQF